MARITKAERAESLAWLRERLKPGDRMYTVLRSVSRSGMCRRIDLYKVHEGRMLFLTGHAAAVLGWTWDRKRGGIRVSGCGMDMGFHLVYTLSGVVFRDAFPDKHRDPGYCLQQEWL